MTARGVIQVASSVDEVGRHPAEVTSLGNPESAPPPVADPGLSYTWRISGLVLLLGVLALHLALRTTELFPVDDAYISFRYAANLARGEGLVFNAGERVEGYSNFLFVVLMAASSKLGVTPPLAARWINLLSVVFLAGCMTLGAADSYHGLLARPVHAGLGWLTGLLLVLSPHTVLNVLSGLEAPATAALLAAGVVFLGRDRPRPAAVSFLLVALSRPEGIVLGSLAGVWDVWRGKARARSRIWRWLLWFAIPYGLFFVWRVVYYGSLLPSSVLAKSGYAASWHLERTLSYMERAAAVYWPLMLLAVMGFAAGRRSGCPPRRATWLLLLGVIGLCLLTGSGDPYQTLVRYLYPGLPLLLMVAGASAQALTSRAFAAGRRPRDVLLGLGAVLLLATQLAVVAHRTGSEIVRQPLSRGAMGVAEIVTGGLAQVFSQDRAPHTSDRLVSLGQHDLARWLLDHAKGDAVLASSQVGIAPYYSGLKVVDTFGLITRHVAELPGSPGAKKDADFVFGQDPDFFVFKKRRDFTGGIPADVELFRDPRLRWRYDLARSFSLGGPQLLLFQRRDRPVLDIRYDFAERFSPRRLGRLDGESWLAGGPALQLVARHERVPFSSMYRRKGLRRKLELSVTNAGADFQGAGAMRRWLGHWRSWIEHRPGTETATAIRYRVRIPDDAYLRFALGAPYRNRLRIDREPEVAVGYSILVEHDGGLPAAEHVVVREQVFSSVEDHGGKPGHRQPRGFQIDLSSYAGQEVTFFFMADRVASARNGTSSEVPPATRQPPVRGGWIEPLLVRRGYWDPAPSEVAPPAAQPLEESKS